MKIVKKLIPYNNLRVSHELEFIKKALNYKFIQGGGFFSKECELLLKNITGSEMVLLTHSCTAALEISALLINIKKDDEVIMPSYSFSSTANAFVLRGGVPVFIDIRKDTLNIDENLIESAITKKTKAIVVVHYAGISAEMDSILKIAKKYNLYVIEDAAQGLMASYKQRSLGSIGDIGAFSFHQTKNITSGEGGAICINKDCFSKRAEMIVEKGTDRKRFLRGEIDKYTWQEIGSSFIPGELSSSFLYAQLLSAEIITNERRRIWERYHKLFVFFENLGFLKIPFIPEYCEHNGHIYYLIISEIIDINLLKKYLLKYKIQAPFHFIPLHSSPAGLKYGRFVGDMKITKNTSDRLIRLPLWVGLTDSDQDYIFEVFFNFFKSLGLI